jgi:hypothetical protein
MKKFIPLFLFISCTESRSQTPEGYRIQLPNKIFLVCDKYPSATSMEVYLTNCKPDYFKTHLMGNIVCSHGVCWER